MWGKVHNSREQKEGAIMQFSAASHTFSSSCSYLSNSRSNTLLDRLLFMFREDLVSSSTTFVGFISRWYPFAQTFACHTVHFCAFYCRFFQRIVLGRFWFFKGVVHLFLQKWVGLLVVIRGRFEQVCFIEFLVASLAVCFSVGWGCTKFAFEKPVIDLCT